MRKILAALGVWLALAGGAAAQTCSALPFTFTANTVIHASQVNSDFSSLLTCANTQLAPLANPAFTGTITGASETLTGTLGLTNNPLTPANGGTGLATLTAHSALLGEGTGNVAFATIGTAGRVLVDQGAGADPAFTALTAGNGVTITGGGSPTIGLTGTVRQVVSTETGAVNTGSTAFPIADSIPQNTAGDQYMSLAITPTNASSTLIIDVVWIGTNSTAGGTAAALFQDANANALAASINAAMNTGAVGSINFRHKMVAGQTTSTTFKVRAGNTTGATTTFNGTAGAREFGGVLASSITITEILP